MYNSLKEPKCPEIKIGFSMCYWLRGKGGKRRKYLLDPSNLASSMVFYETPVFAEWIKKQNTLK